MTKKNKNTGTQRLTGRSIWCYWRGSRLKSCWYCYWSTIWNKDWNETDEKKQEHGNTKTYKLINAVLLARKPSGIVLILLSFKYLKEKKDEMRRMKKKNKNTGTQRLTRWSIRCFWPGSQVESCWSGYRVNTWKKKSWNEMDDKEKQEHGNIKTYKSVNAVFLSRKLSWIVLILFW